MKNQFLHIKNSLLDKGKSLTVTYDDVVPIMDIDAFWREMENVLQAQKEHFMQHITLR